MEEAALSAADPLLPQGWSGVGIELNIKHLSASPAGIEVRAWAELAAVKRLKERKFLPKKRFFCFY
ncbi:MAG: hypothetical protein LBE10_01565 [Treponema sp.]|jgi:predicted thioesterase|nr:hypothetical protein [Treponema sp.]